MAKDLRTLLEHAQKGAGGGNQPAPLAHRRAMTSPGEPRVYRVKTGYVCGLCGRLHDTIDPAFDCLSRCTFELRLRSPAGRALSGDAGHYACTACGRGYANTDDAEECFERCLAKMKPSKQFEEALRRVQIKYVQRLQAHGLRSLQKIDALSEHTKMLETLTYEQKALGRNQSKPVEKVLPKRDKPAAAPAPQASSITELKAFNPSQENKQPSAGALSDLAPDELTAAGTGNVSTEESLMNDVGFASADVQEGARADVALSPAGAGDAGFVAETAFGNTNAESAGGGDEAAELLGGSFSDAGSSGDAADALLGGSFSDAGSSGDAESLLSGDFAGAESSGGAEALLGSSFDDAAAPADLDALLADSNQPFANKTESFRAQKSALSPDLLESLRSADPVSPKDVKGGARKAPVFTRDSEEPETNAMAADVLAMLQTSDSSETVTLSSRQERQLDTLKINVDTEFLDTADPAAESGAALTVYVRSPDMKPYRRNNAKYACSACSNEFFTKEQVEACFFAHPEEGSEEARALLAKGMKLAGKSAA
ncbi:MAG: calcium-binding protein [Proteobacteria bacterium]|nr:calcium-binding protein [Pseudomonadota bacterium]